MNLALDRMEEISEDKIEYVDKDFNADRYFGEVIGATVSETQRPQNVIFFVTRKHTLCEDQTFPSFSGDCQRRRIWNNFQNLCSAELRIGKNDSGNG
jgi:hypothetical protein